MEEMKIVLERNNAVQLPKDDKHIIALLYSGMKIKDFETKELLKEEVVYYLADGEMDEENSNEYVFEVFDKNHEPIFCENIPLCGYKEETFINEGVMELNDCVEVTFEYRIEKYVVVDFRIVFSDEL